MSTTTRTTVAKTVLGLAVLLLASGCGGGDAESSGSGGDPTATVTVTASPTASSTGAPTGSPTESATASASASTFPITPGPPVDLRQPPATFAEARAHVEAATDVTDGGADELAAFVTPSGNIYCGLDQPDQVAGCEIRAGQVEDPAACPDNPMTQRVGRLEIHGDEAVAVCNTDTIVLPGAPTLDYGTSAFTRDTACVSEQVGVTCISRGADVGFFLARGRYAVLSD